MTKYKFVPELNGIEIYFDEKPSTSVCEELKSNGWRWHRVKKCWFTKKSSESEKFAKMLCEGMEKSDSFQPAPKSTVPFKISVSQNSRGQQVSTLTISPSDRGYNITSTNNQIICCDCNRFFSIHADACPFCGCPLHYIAEHYYEIYKDDAGEWEMQREKESQKRFDEKEYKLNTIRDLYRNYNINYREFKIFEQLLKLDITSFDVAIERAKNIDSISDVPKMSDEDWLGLLQTDQVAFSSALMRLQYINMHADELPYISNEQLHNLMKDTGSAFKKKIQKLISVEEIRRQEELHVKQQAERKAEEQTIAHLCGKYNISTETLNSWISQCGSLQELVKRLNLIEELEATHQDRHLNLLAYLHLSQRELVQLVKDIVK